MTVDSSPRINVREANLNDRKAVWSWRQDCIHYGLIDNSVVSPDGFRLWFDNVLNSEDRRMFIGTQETLRIGAALYVRRTATEWEERLLLKPFYLGKGLGEVLSEIGRKRLEARFQSASLLTVVRAIA